jgi:hypothetical protein
MRERFEQQLKEFTEQRRLTEFNLHRLDAVIAFIQQELEVMETEEGKEQNADLQKS